MPATLDNKDYPKLIKAGERVETIAVPTVLAVYNWKRDKEHFGRMTRFIDYLFDRLPQLQKAPYDASWKDVNLASTVPGWRRYEPMQQKLEAMGVGGGAPPRVQASSTGRRVNERPDPRSSTRQVCAPVHLPFPFVDTQVAREAAAQSTIAVGIQSEDRRERRGPRTHPKSSHDEIK